MAESPGQPLGLQLIWEHDLVFAGTSGDAALTLDSAGLHGPSPVQALAFGLAGCMAMDVVFVLRKGRHDLRGFRADLTGERAADHPRRFTTFTLALTINGHIPEDVVDRAIQLSREKYCSVWHSLRQDITLTVTRSVSSTEPGA
ncbi:MAG TPA: OsmC family protein [Vicinamibacterales bacterium]|jgi:putative redox protein|nr:OsmC family protein [Vicinamibacterales bacterium]